MDWFVKLAVLFFILLFPYTNEVDATLYTVCAAGSPTCTISTVTEVNSLVLVGGDTVSFNRGESFTDKELEITWSGSPGNRIKFNSYGSGAEPILVRVESFYTSPSDYIEIDGLYFTGTSASPRIYIDSGSYWYIANSYAVSGHQTTAPTVWIRTRTGETPSHDNTFYNTYIANGGTFQADGSGGNGNVNVTGSSYNNVFDNVTIKDGGEYGLQVYGGSTICSVGIAYNNTIVDSYIDVGIYERGINFGYCSYNNYAQRVRVDNGTFFGVGFDRFLTGSTYLIDSIIYNADKAIDVLGGYSKIFNNTIIYGDKSTDDAVEYQANSASLGGHELKNNIIIQNPSSAQSVLQIDSGYTVDSNNNIFYGKENIIYAGTTYTDFGDYQSESGQDASSQYTDPLIDAALYSPQSGSPAINAGTNLSAYFTDDYAGNPRLGAWDIGAYEYTEGTRQYINVGFSGVEIR